MFCPTKNVLDFLAKLDHSGKIISLTKLVQEMLSHLKKVGALAEDRKDIKNFLSEENETCSLFATASINWAIFILWNNTKAANLFVWFQQLFGLSFIPAPTLRCCHMLELDGYYKLLLLVNLCSNVPHSLMPHCPSHRPKCTIVISDGTFHFYSSIENFLFKKEQIRERLDK